ncbi:hypothetical protein ACWFNS_01490 [Oerskovia enterophila]
MLSPGVGLLRGVRAGLLATAVVGLSLVSHGLAGGAPPGAVPVVVLVMVTAVLLRSLVGRRVGLPYLLGVLGLGQLAFHYTFEQCALLSSTSAPAHAHASDRPEVMLAAHVVATLVVSVFLTHADRVLWALWSWLTMRSVPGAAPLPLARGRNLLFLPPVLPVPTAPGRGSVRGRAPPVVVLAAAP